MAASSRSHAQQLREALAEWAAAIEAVNANALRVVRGGELDPDATAILMMAVELARLNCRLLEVDPGVAKPVQ